MGNTLTEIILHHSGPVGNDRYSSSRHHTWKDISNWHKNLWQFPSKYIDGSHAGYNTIYDPKTREFKQTRAIGEETAHAVGYNNSAYGLCIIGNYTLDPRKNDTVDPMTETMEKDISSHVLSLINGNADNLIVAPETVLSFSMTRVGPHRAYQANRECYGSGLSDNWIKDILSKYKKTKQGNVRERIRLLQLLLKLYMQLYEAKKRELGGEGRSCEGFIN